MQQNKPLSTYIFAFFAMAFWGMSFVWTKMVLDYYEPISIIFIRLLISSAILFLFMHLFNRNEKILKKDWKWFIISALFSPFLYFIGENYGVKFTSPAISAILVATIPLFTPVAAYYTFKERLSWLNIAGMFLSFFGIIIMLVDKNLSFTAEPLGIFMLFGAVFSAVIYSVIIKKLSERYSSTVIISYQNLLGAVYFMPVFLIFDYNHFAQVTPTTMVIINILLLAVFGSSLAFIFFTMVIRDIGISRANILTNFIPVFTAIFSFFILSEYFDLAKITGMAIVIGGILLSQLDKGRKLFASYRFIWPFNNHKK
ncbi:MAG: DMT family transporter [Bacteroidales bacterium]|nr:DMT family transporter [Bacteroidales bacterium]